MNYPIEQVLICQNRTCRRQGSQQVKVAFLGHPVQGIQIIGSSCLGECGNGVMVLILPEKTWYWHITPQHVPLIVKQHLIGHSPVIHLLDPKYHWPQKNP